MRKKVLLSFIAMCGLIFTAFAEDVTATYLQNYAKPFAAGSGFLIQGNERFKEIGTPWITAGNVGGPMGTANLTGWHIDSQKQNAITLTVGWDGFAESINNAKVYQPVTLPAGNYILRVYSPQDKSGASDSYLVVATGEGLPDIENLNTALASKVLTGISGTDAVSILFSLSESTSVSMGIVASMSNGSCITIGEFVLETGAVDYSDLKAVIKKAENITTDKYSLGTEPGQYSQEKWNALQAALTAAKDFLAKPGDSPQQSDVIAKETVLKGAIDAFLSSLVTPFELSDHTTEKWYRVVNKTEVADALYFNVEENRLRYRDSTTVVQDDEKFKFVEETSGTFKIYSFLKPKIALSVNSDNNKVIEAVENSNRDVWKLIGSTATGYYCIISATIGGYMMNAYSNQAEGIVASWYNTGDAGSSWTFIPVTSPSGISEETALQFGIKVENRRIVANENVKISVFNIGGQFVDAKSELSPGAYIVKAEGYPKAFKVMVK